MLTQTATRSATVRRSVQALPKLDEKEYGRLASSKHRYIHPRDGSKELPKYEEDLPGYYTFLTTYLCYLMLIMVGHATDFVAKTFNTKSARGLKAKDGLAPLFDDFDSFYTRRLKHRLDDCFARVVTGVPGRIISVLERYSPDYNDSFVYTGKLLECINLSSYNYLGFAQSVGPCATASEESVTRHGLLTGGTRGMAGTLDLHIKTEEFVADFVGKEASIVFSMGYSTNTNLFATLADRHSLVISDELNHASIRVGLRISGAVIKVFKHNDMEDLERLLREQISQGQPRTHRPWKKIIVAVEGLYSMEGTVCNLPELVRLRRRYRFHLFVDEAHSIGAMGPRGRGVCDMFDIDPDEVDMLMGTFTKSFGANGGYVAADKVIIDKLRADSMGCAYTESISPPVLTQITTALKIIAGESNPEEGAERLQRLAFNTRYLRLGLRRLGFLVGGHDNSPIIPLMLYQPPKMPLFSRMMLEKNIAVVVVGYPATPLTSSRVRFCMSSALTKHDLDRTLAACDELGDLLRLKISQYKCPGTGQPYRWKLKDVLDRLEDDVHKDWVKEKF